MFTNLKVNNSDLSGIVNSLKKGNDFAAVKNTGDDFYSMVMNYNADGPHKENTEKKIGSESSRKSLNDRCKVDENHDESIRREEEAKPSKNDMVNGETAGSEISRENKTHDKNEESISVKEKNKLTKSEKEDGKQDEVDSMLQIIAGKLASANLAELIEAAVKGEIKISDFNAKFKKITDEIISSKKHSVVNGENLSHNYGEKTDTVKDNSAAIMNKFLDKLSHEISKLIHNRKGDNSKEKVTVKELKETLGAIIDDIKKGRNRNHDKSDVRRIEQDEIRNEKKSDMNSNSESQIVKKRDSGSEGSFDPGAGKERNSSRENNSFSSAKIDSAGRVVIEKNELTMKTPEFRQSLQEIIDKAKISVRNSSNASFSVKLFPKELGSVNINLLMENGVVSGKFMVENDEARNLLLANLGVLREQLSEAGIEVGDFNVNVNHEGERFAGNNDDDQTKGTVNHAGGRTETAVSIYDNNSTAMNDGHINMVI